MRKIHFAVVLALLIAASEVHHLRAQSADEAAIKRIEPLWDDNQ